MIKNKLIPFCLFNLVTMLSFGDEFPFNPPENFKLNPAYVSVRHPVKTQNILAQLYFDQGFTFLYAFNHDAAYWSFLRAKEADPEMAMAYWGMALSLGTNINMQITPERSKAAYELIQKGIELSKEGPENEKEYIQVLSKRYTQEFQTDQKPLAVDYSNAMRSLKNKYPDDLDAAVLFSESLLDVNPWNQWSIEGKPYEGTMEAVHVLNDVLKRDPNHLGANHYYIHAVEASKHPEMALMSANRLKSLLPSSGHILHMPSHIYLLVGDYHAAAQANEDAVAADREYIRHFGNTGIYPVHYLSHNYYFLYRAYTMEGNFDRAKDAADTVASFYLPHYQHMPELEVYASAPLTVLITFHRWKDILKVAKPNEEMKMINVLWHFGRAIAYAHLKDLPKALEEQKLFEAEKERLSKEDKFGYNDAGKIVIIADLSLKAAIAEKQNRLSDAIDYLKQGIAQQDALHYNEPPDWFFPIRETLGGLLLKNNRPAEAENVFREELNRHPRNGRALFGLKESLKDLSKNSDYYWVNEEFQKAWKYSDIPLTRNDL